MLTLHLEAWINHVLSAPGDGEQPTRKVFDLELMDPIVVEYYRQRLDALERGPFVAGEMRHTRHSYRLTFYEEHRMLQEYSGIVWTGTWMVRENGERKSLDVPTAILDDLYVTYSLPISEPPPG
jgi:hypothetical protein